MTTWPTLAQAIKNALFVFVLTAVCALSFSLSAQAAIPQTISYQARLWTATGVPVGDATYPIKFSLYTVASGGSPIWTAKGSTGAPSALNVTVVNGAFTVLLGDAATNQNPLSEVNWNQDSLYLGITIDADAEMTPRRPLSSVPQAFLSDNALRIQGMSPSSTAYGSQTLFTIHQTEPSAATGTRSALDVRSEGTSNAFDYLFRGINDLGTTVFSLNRAGNVSSTGSLSVSNGLYAGQGLYVGAGSTFYGESQLSSAGSYTASSTLALNLYGAGGLSRLTLDGSGILLSSGAGSIHPLADLGSSLGEASLRFNAYLGQVTSTRLIADTATTTKLDAAYVSSTSLDVSSELNADRITSNYINNANSIATRDLSISGAFTSQATAATIGAGLSYATSLPGIRHMQAIGDRLYVQSSSTISIFDTSDAGTERLIGTIQGSGADMVAFTVRGNAIYFVYNDTLGGQRRLVVMDITNPANPTYLGGIKMPLALMEGADIAVVGQAAYVASTNASTLLVYNIGNLDAITLADTISLSGNPKTVSTDGKALYVVMSDNLAGAVNVYALTQPLNPVLADTVTTGAGSYGSVIKGSILYVLNTVAKTINAFDVSDPFNVASLETQSFGESPTVGVLIGNRILFGTAEGILDLVDVTSATDMMYAGAIIMQAGNKIWAVAAAGRQLFMGFGASTYVATAGISGMTTGSLEAGEAKLFSLSVQGAVQSQGDLRVAGGVSAGRGGVYSLGTVSSYVDTPTSTAGRFFNASAYAADTAWGVYTNRLLVGENVSATGAKQYVATFVNNSAQNQFGLCLDDLATAETCIDFASTSTAYSLLADNAIGANAFDLAERYHVSGEASLGDVLVLDPDQPMRMKKSPGIAYDDRLSGVVSTRPGFILGAGGDVSVALVGRVPVNVTVANGVILPGDALTSSERPGYAMKATRAGKIIGRALQGTSVDGQIEVYLQPGFDASPLLQADGGMTVIAQDAGFQAASAASALAPAQPSRALSFRGSAWDGSAPVVSEFRLYNQVSTPSDAALSVAYGASSSSVFALTANGSLTLAGDLALAGRLYPSARGQAQHESYLFVDDTQPGARYMSTNADGWQSQDGYDYAERYQSPDKLEPGDLVVVRRSERLYVQRSLNETDMLVGIVSTKPGFVAGKTADDSYPIALAGRVPTKVSTINGAIAPGDPLAPSSIPGVAVKATKPGPIVGLALDSYADADVGKIEVFVNPTWWGGEASERASAAPGRSKEAQGFGEITAGKTRAHVRLSGFVAYPHLQVTPYAQMENGWWIENVSAGGFDLVLGGAIGHNARFAWSAQETAEGAQVSLSNGQAFSIDPISGQIQFPPGASDTDIVEEVPAEEPSEPIAEPTPSSTEDILVPAPTSTEPLTDPSDSVSEPTEAAE